MWYNIRRKCWTAPIKGNCIIEKRWEERFQPWILERGRNYWKENCVGTLCCTEMLKDAMYQASDKNEYRRVVGYLSGLRDCPNGEEAVSSLVAYWRETFKRRSSMLWELEKAGH